MADDPWIGTVLAERFRIESPYYRTQSAEMYRGIDLSSEQEVVVHLAHEKFNQNREFFEEENRRLQALDHPAIIPILAAGQERERLFMVSPFLRGGSLENELRGEWSLEQTNKVMERIGDALVYLHRREIIHMNVSADSIIFDEASLPYLSMGFGRIWRHTVFSSGRDDIYSYPEPERMNYVLTHPKVDVYALGIVLWFMLLGELPYPDAPLDKQLAERWPRTDLPEGWRSVIERAISANPSDRFNAMPEFLAAWKEVQGQSRPGFWQRARQKAQEGRDAAAQYFYGDPQPKQEPEATVEGWASTNAVTIRGDEAHVGSAGINLRAEPRPDAPMIGRAVGGSTLAITGARVGEYVPVRVRKEDMGAAVDLATTTPPTAKAPDYTQIDQMLAQEVDEKVAQGNVDAAADVASYIESPQVQQTAYQQIEQKARPQTKASQQTSYNIPSGLYTGEGNDTQTGDGTITFSPEPLPGSESTVVTLDTVQQEPSAGIPDESTPTNFDELLAEFRLVESVPLALWPGQTFAVALAVQNTGAIAWDVTHPNSLWSVELKFADVEATLPLQEPLGPGQSATVRGSLTTPDTPGDYPLVANLQLRAKSGDERQRFSQAKHLVNLTISHLPDLDLANLLNPPSSLNVAGERAWLETLTTIVQFEATTAAERETVVQKPLLAILSESGSKRVQIAAATALQQLAPLPTTQGTVETFVTSYLRENAAAQTIFRSLTTSRNVNQSLRQWLQARLDESQPSEVNSEQLAVNSDQSPVSNLQSPHNGQPPTTNGQPPAANRQPPAALIPPPPPTFFSSFHLSLDQVVQTERPPQTMTLRVTPQNVLLTFAGKNYESRSKLGEIDLKSFVLNRLKYGKALFDAVCHDKDLTDKADNATLKGFTLAMAGLTEGLYIQLYLDDTLHGICWENLCDVDGNPLSISQKTPLYRRVRDNVEKQRVDYGKLRILVMICNPDELGKPIGHEALESLKPVDVANERKILESALQRLEKAGLAEYTIYDGAPGREATLENLRAALKPQDGTAYYILHIVAHGIQTNKGFQLVMARQDAKFPLVDADTFKADLHDSELRLAILTSCFSATVDEDEEADSPASGRTLPGLAQQLVSEAEIPAVIAMQGLLKADTAALFHHHFYDELARCGRVARAMAVTRRELYNIEKSKPKAGWGVPALFMGTDDDWLFGMDKQKVKQLEPLPSLSSETQKRLREGDWEGLQQQLAAHLPEGLASLAAASPLFAPAAPTRPLTLPQNVRYLQDALRPRTQLNAANLATYVQKETGLVLDPIVYRQVASALNTGKHILLTGPPGTGKTSLAQAICAYAQMLQYSDDPILTTATADWTTFDTIGGYVPDTKGQLQFRAGIFLRAIRDASWLVIDEMNRAEIDKAFGELFTVLSGQPIELPYNVDGKSMRVLPAAKGADWLPKQDDEAFNIVIHPAWRIIGTMNVYDKSFLFNMSFAFMRRFAFIDVDLPSRATYHNLLHRWLLPKELADGNAAAPFVALGWLLQQLVTEDTILMRRRALGPAILKDMIAYVRNRYEEEGNAAALLDIFGEAFIMYALPQLDGLDHDSILAIYAHLDQLTAQLSPVMRFTLLRRLKMLYPHISTAEWEQAVLKAAQTS